MSEKITIVSGLPRSGTSMMMKMLDAGGIEPVIDNIREADVDNPKGYYELEIAKKIKDDVSWLPGTKGKAFKMVSMLLSFLPADYEYKVVFMRRNMDEILASQSKMIDRLGEKTGDIDDEQMAMIFSQHLKQIDAWLTEQPNIEVIEIQYNDVLNDPASQAQRLNDFLDQPLDENGMSSIVDLNLYRNRS